MYVCWVQSRETNCNIVLVSYLQIFDQVNTESPKHKMFHRHGAMYIGTIKKISAWWGSMWPGPAEPWLPYLLVSLTSSDGVIHGAEVGVWGDNLVPAKEHGNEGNNEIDLLIGQTLDACGISPWPEYGDLTKGKNSANRT